MGEYDEVFEALSEHHRRQLLVELLLTPQRIPEPTGAAQEMLDANEALLREQLTRAGSIRDVDEYVVSMHSIHLPKLAEDELITWHRETDLITQGPNFGDAKPFLKLLVEQRDERRTADPVVTVVDGV